MSVAVLLSGGLDSTVALAWVLQCGVPVDRAIFFRYGQYAQPSEFRAAYDITRYYQVPLNTVVVELPAARVPKCPIHSQPDPAACPNRNMIFVSMAEAICESYGIGSIVLGAHLSDTGNGCSCKYAVAHWAARMSAPQGLQIYMPLVLQDKHMIVKLAWQWKVPIDLTWSCYTEGPTPCGQCASCKEREEALVWTPGR